SEQTLKFDGQRAYQDVEQQLAFGPRLPGSPAHTQWIEWATAELGHYGWQVELQEGQVSGHPVRNLVAQRGETGPWIILGAHYDSRQVADKDPNPRLRQQPVPGANDGASGVAVLMELARTLPKNDSGRVWLVFFDAEDQGNTPGWDWILGSQYFAQQLQEQPDAVVVIDMIGDKDLNIYQEKNSNAGLTTEIWNVAAELGYAQNFIPEYKYAILDDHLPFLQKGIPAVDLIDFDYPSWHTTQDTADKVSPQSLQAVGDTLWEWIHQRNNWQN
ncbi:MAG: M28 family peptidase, partial [Chloroflexi bacterium]|nr:M28 family peptidase [Chloroflexota bacterium]